MLFHSRSLVLVVAFVVPGLGNDDYSGEKGKDKPSENPTDVARINKLIRQLGSTFFSEREAARKEIESIGEFALEPLREAAKSSRDIETKRRVEQLADQIELTVLDRHYKEGLRLHELNMHDKAIKFFEQAIKIGTNRYHPDRIKAPVQDTSYLSDTYLQLARAAKSLGDFEMAGKAFAGAVYYAGGQRERRRKIDEERDAFAAQLVKDWTRDVKEKIDKDESSKALLAKYPLTLLHSRRYAGGHYLQSAFSFIYETTDSSRHLNDVQLLFDNGMRDYTFDLNMLTGQKNRLADLGAVDFEKNPDLKKINADDKIAWRSDDRHRAIVGHVYLEHVKDERGNDFFVLFRVVAVEKDSKYVAFVWRRLPGGKVVKQQ